MTDAAARRRREVARATQPDAGGSHEAFVEAMRAFEQAPPRTVLTVHHSRTSRLRRSVRRLLRRAPRRTLH